VKIKAKNRQKRPEVKKQNYNIIIHSEKKVTDFRKKQKQQKKRKLRCNPRN